MRGLKPPTIKLTSAEQQALKEFIRRRSTAQ